MKDYICWHMGKSHSVRARTEFEAQTKAIDLFGLRASLQHLVIVRRSSFNAASDQYGGRA